MRMRTRRWTEDSSRRSELHRSEKVIRVELEVPAEEADVGLVELAAAESTQRWGNGMPNGCNPFRVRKGFVNRAPRVARGLATAGLND
jgi:hypothetical protein